MRLINIVRDAARRLSEEVEVEVDTKHDWVVIRDLIGQHEDIFMQGQDAVEFIEECQAVWRQCQFVTKEECYLHHAEQYCNTLWDSDGV